jgi:TonB family protein
MRTLVFCILLFSASLSVRSQNDSIVNKDIEQPFINIEQMPEFVGGSQALMKFVHTLAVYTDKARADNVSGAVFLSFIVETDGSLKNPKVLRGLHKDLDSISLEIIRSMPKWIPGKENGKPHEIQFNVPVKFVLSQEPGAKTPIPSAYWRDTGKTFFMQECSVRFKKSTDDCECWYNFILWNYNSLKLYDLDLKLMFEKFRCE